MGKKKGETTTTQTSSAPAYFEPYIKQGLSRADRGFARYADTPYFPGQTYADFAPESQGAFGQISRLAGDPRLSSAAAESATATLRGDYLDPTRDPRFGRALDSIENRIGSRFAAGNRMGSGAFHHALADAETGAAAQLYGDERQRMVQMAGLSPGINQARYLDPQMLRQVGAEREAQSQRGIDEDVARYETDVGGARYQQWLDNYNRQIAMSPAGRYGVQTYTQPWEENKTAAGLGGAMSGAQMGMAAGPWGALAGAVAGGALGAFG